MAAPPIYCRYRNLTPCKEGKPLVAVTQMPVYSDSAYNLIITIPKLTPEGQEVAGRSWGGREAIVLLNAGEWCWLDRVRVFKGNGV